MKGIVFSICVLLNLCCGFLVTRFCYPILLARKKISVTVYGVSVFLGLIFLTGTVLGLNQLYRAAFLAVAVILLISARESRAEKLFWFVIFYCITVLLEDIAILVLPGILNMRMSAPGASEIKTGWGTLALTLALAVSFLFVTSQRKDCECDLRSSVILTLIVILLTGIADGGFLVFRNVLADYTLFIVGAAVAALIAFLSVLLCRRLSMYNRQVRSLEKTQLINSNMEERVREMDQFYELVSSLRHDIHQQLAVADMLDLQGYSAERTEFLRELSAGLPSVFNTGIPALDALLSLKSYECRKGGILFDCQLCDLKEHPMSVTDITSVFNNLLNNAMEAQRGKASEGKEKDICLVVKRTRNVLFAECSNPVFRSIQMDDRGKIVTTKQESGHGYGIESIRSTIERAGGECSFGAREGRFIAEFFVPYNIEYV